MLLPRPEKLPEGTNWMYELKLDGFRSDPSKQATEFTSVLETTKISMQNIPPSSKLWRPMATDQALGANQRRAALPPKKLHDITSGVAFRLRSSEDSSAPEAEGQTYTN